MSKILPISPPPGFTKLTKEQKIDYVQALWDLTIDNSSDDSTDEEDIETPDWHLEILQQRLASPAPIETLKNWDEVKSELLQFCL